eukprot:scaffold241_cov340-Pavlova_lutheri.AAC.12
MANQSFALLLSKSIPRFADNVERSAYHMLAKRRSHRFLLVRSSYFFVTVPLIDGPARVQELCRSNPPTVDETVFALQGQLCVTNYIITFVPVSGRVSSDHVFLPSFFGWGKERVGRRSIVVSIPACHAGDPGSIPGDGGETQPRPAEAGGSDSLFGGMGTNLALLRGNPGGGDDPPQQKGGNKQAKGKPKPTKGRVERCGKYEPEYPNPKGKKKNGARNRKTGERGVMYEPCLQWLACYKEPIVLVRQAWVHVVDFEALGILPSFRFVRQTLFFSVY